MSFDFNSVAQSFGVLANIAAIPISFIAGVAGGYVGAWWALNKQRQSAEERNLIDNHLPLLRTEFKKVSGKPHGKDHDMYEQRIRARDEIDLEKVYGTNTELYVGYLHKAAQMALKSDDPIVWNHLMKALTDERNPQAIYDDIVIELKNHISKKLYAASGVGYDEEDHPMITGYPVIVAEKAAQRVQMRVFFTTEEQKNLDTLPKPEELLVEKGKGKFVHDPNDYRMQHLETRRFIAQKLTDSSKLVDDTFVEYHQSKPTLAA